MCVGSSELESNRPPNVVHDEVEAIKVERVYRIDAKLAKARPAVVVTRRAFRQSETGQIPRDSAEPARGEFAEDFALAERRAQHSVNAHNGFAIAFRAQEALYAAGGECLAGVAVGGQDVGCRKR
jgi:hypothetical protein